MARGQGIVLTQALAYAARGWRVMPLHNIENGICTCRAGPNRPKAGAECPSPGKHPRIKTGRNFAAATVDRAQIEAWFNKWPNSNIGIATGSRSNLVVVDLDGEQGFATLRGLLNGRALPDTLIAASGRIGIGAHLYFTCSEISPTNSGNGLDVRGDGGLVVAPPSMHVSGRPYAWVSGSEPAAIPLWLLDWFRNRDGSRGDRQVPGANSKPAYLQRSTAPDLVSVAKRALSGETELEDLFAVVDVMPNDNAGWDQWNRIGMAIWAASEGSQDGLDAFHDWSAKSKKYTPEACDERWRAYAGTPPDSIGFGSLVFEARKVDPVWTPPSQTRKEVIPQDQAPHTGTLLSGQSAQNFPTQVNGYHGPIAGSELIFSPKSGDPLIELNNKFCVIGNLGGRCMVMEWIDSPADETVKIPSFQTFRAFSERFANRYVERFVDNGKGGKDQETKQLGSEWLKWHARRTFESMDLDPTGAPLLKNNTLNLWTGFGVQPVAGHWERMQEHICEVLADGDAQAASYIIRWAAWSVQHAAERPETALVFRGGKGVGKGTFGHAMRRLFGQHGLHISNSKHLVGQFNGHLRNTILLLADEAFWAGDKQGESTLKSLLTEPTIMVENKGIDPTPWRNRLHVIMLANAEWVVPASSDERRYAVFNVSDRHQREGKYFDKIHAEMANGGLPAMLHDLQHVDLKGWHPRDVLETRALREQKQQSFSPLDEWFEGLLQSGYLPMMDADGRVPAFGLLNMAREAAPKLKDCSAQQLGRYLSKRGGTAFHTARGQVWRFPLLGELRAGWTKRYSGWDWDASIGEWQHK
jgi:hypothetical protein